MILRRLLLQGFLSFREPKEIVFGDAPVWMLSGPNGSGKSSVFDALTFALFAAHRGGKQNAEELINKDSDGFVIELDLELGTTVYRIRRTLSRGNKSTRQVLRGEPGDEDRWTPLPGTEKDEGFKRWVGENIGLSFETFTASVLLTQGGAERLISATPADRLVVLKGIVGLDRYERLQKKVDDRRKALESQAEAAKRKLDAMIDPGDEARDAARAAIAVAEAARDGARAEADRLASLAHQAARWAEIQAELAEVRTRLDGARSLLAEADAIGRDRDRLAELRAVVPLLEAAFAHARSLAESEMLAGRLETDRAGIETRLSEALERSSVAAERLAELRRAIDADAIEERALAGRLREIAAMVGRLDLFEAQETEVKRLESLLAAEPEREDLDAARDERDRLEALASALPAIERLARAADDLRAAEAAKADAARIEAESIRRGPGLRAEHDELAGRSDRASTALREAEARAASAKTIRDLATASRERAEMLADALNCDHCGQPLTPGHLQAERRRRAAELKTAEAEVATSERAVEAARRDEAALRVRLAEAHKLLTAAREQLTASRKAQAEAESRIAAAESARALALAELPEPLRDAIGSDPSSSLATFKVEAKRLPAARKRLAAAEEARRKQDTLRDRLQNARSLRDAQAALLPAAPEGLRPEMKRLESQCEGLAAIANERRTERDRIEADGAKLAATIRAAEARLGKIAQEASGVEARRETAAAAIARAVAALPEPWRDRGGISPEGFAAELRDLEAGGIEARAESLSAAASEWGHLQSRRDDLERQAGAVPEEARATPSAIAARLDSARADLSRAESAAHAANAESDRLDRIQVDRAALAAEKVALDGQAATASALARLLGPRGLQRHLVRRAERDIVRFANERLDRLSGGSLSLRLRARPEGETDETALDLEAHDRRTRRTVAVAFLSGSQRFRVAVALALAIGQLAASNSRPIESVIIDEGFGCLDREGRQVMIRELRNLGRGVRRVLLVSHQEEFADAFPDGCRLALEGGATVVGPLTP